MSRHRASFRRPPEYGRLEPEMMSTRELRETHESLWEWIVAAEEAPACAAPDEVLISEVRAAMNRVIAERRDRHADERARGRGGS